MPSSSFVSHFVLGQAVGATAAGFFAFSTLSISPFNYISITEAKYAQGLSTATKATILKQMLFGRGRPAMLGSVALGIVGFATAYANRPVDISVEHARAIIIGATALLVSVPHTVVAMLPIYKDLGAVADLPEDQQKARYAVHLKRYLFGNGIRLGLFGVAYLAGLYGLASSAPQ